MIIYDSGSEQEEEEEEEKRIKNSVDNLIAITKKRVDVSTSHAVKKAKTGGKVKKLTLTNRAFLKSLGLQVK